MPCSPIFLVQGSQGSDIDTKRDQIIAVETTMQCTYAIASKKPQGRIIRQKGDLFSKDGRAL
jgi:hypothetical protein